MTNENYPKEFGTSINQLKEQQQIDYNNPNYSNTDLENITNSKNSEQSNIYNDNLNPNISKLVTDINKSLDDYSEPDSSKMETKNDIDTEIDINTDEQNEKWLSKIPNWVKEIVLFVILYFILSMGFVKKSIGTYIKYIIPNDEGNVSFIGIIIYGIILIVSFMLIKYSLGIN